MEQMTIFDFIDPVIPDTFDNLPERDMVTIISNAVGIDFQPHDGRWVSKKKGIEFTVHYSNYSIEDNKRFISCGWNGRMSGAHSPCDTIEAAIKFFKYAKARYENGDC